MLAKFATSTDAEAARKREILVVRRDAVHHRIRWELCSSVANITGAVAA